MNTSTYQRDKKINSIQKELQEHKRRKSRYEYLLKKMIEQENNDGLQRIYNDIKREKSSNKENNEYKIKHIDTIIDHINSNIAEHNRKKDNSFSTEQAQHEKMRLMKLKRSIEQDYLGM